MLQVIRTTDCPETPWKNGGGTTREIAVFPPGADMDSFVWRLSMARVATAGPFSHFAGIDRTLVVLQGMLHLAGDGCDVMLDDASAPHAFPADSPFKGTPIGGDVQDLNAMVRRGFCTTSIERLAKGDRASSASGRLFLIALEAQQVADTELGVWDCAEIDGHVTPGGAALLVTFALPWSIRPATCEAIAPS